MSEFKETVSKYSKIDRSFLIIENSENFPNIERGIVFVFAAWSGDSVVRFGLLTETLSQLDLGNLKIHVLDTDKLNYQGLKQIPVLHGYGETFWIKNYKIQNMLHGKEADFSKIVLYTKELFADSRNM